MIKDTKPWYSWARRWGQTNLTEIDPTRYDTSWWRDHWKRTAIDGVIINAGGIVAYYPSRLSLQKRAIGIDQRDLYGEIVAEARSQGLAVVARMDSNRADEAFYREHPDWFALDGDGTPYRAGDKYVSCVNSAYYDEYLPEILREVIDRSSPDGFADNSWAGLSRAHICYCENCSKKFRDYAGTSLPRSADWESETYRAWVTWNYERRTEIWKFNNQVTQDAGGRHCVWSGMISGDMAKNSGRFVDVKSVLAESKIVMLDHQRRNAKDGFEQNAEVGLRLRGMLGWDKAIVESTALYQWGTPGFRLASMPEAEVRIWATQGFAGGIQPWWHHIGSVHEDKRQYETAEPLFQWHRENEQYLLDRSPHASVGVVWSQKNNDFVGKADPENRTFAPYRGVWQSLVRERIPFIPVNIDDLAREIKNLKLLILPNLAAMSEEHCNIIRSFVDAGGSVIASGDTSLNEENGDLREDFALGDVFGIRATHRYRGAATPADPNIEVWSRHSYLRLETDSQRWRGSLLSGFENTDLIPFGGLLHEVVTRGEVGVPLNFVPEFPIYPPETSWMRPQAEALPALVSRTHASGGRTVYLAADIDRCASRDEHPDHFRLMANILGWATQGDVPFSITGQGKLTAHSYEQQGRIIVHLGNATSTTRTPGRHGEIIPIGPFTMTLPFPDGNRKVNFLVSGAEVVLAAENGTLTVDIPSVDDHEVIVISPA